MVYLEVEMKKKVNLSLDEEVVVILKQLAEESYKPVSQWVTDAVLQAAKEKEKEGKNNELN